MADGVGVVIPAYRPDSERLAQYVESLHASLAPERLLVELDAPSRAVLAALEGSPATVRVSEDRRGKGAAITAGFDHLDTPILAFTDADGSTPADSLEAVIAAVREGRAELSVGSRRLPEARVLGHQTRVRRHLGDLFARLARRTLPVALSDYQCGAKAIDRHTWASVRRELVSPGFAWDIELIALAHARGARIVEVPIVWEDRPGTTVPVIGTTSAFARALLRAYHRDKCLRGSHWHRRLDRTLGEPTPLIRREDVRSHEAAVGPK